jgi:hypothetical protein
MTPYITIISDQLNAATRQARHDWAAVTGKAMESSPSIYVDTRTGLKYTSIVVAIAWPGIEPGCMIIAGIQADPRINILDYSEHKSVYNLLTDVIETRKSYRYGEHDGILQAWVGDPERYQTIAVAVSTAIERKSGSSRGLYVREPVDWTEKHRFPMYVRQLHDSLAKKLLNLNGHSDLISRLQSFQPDAADKGKIEDYPAVGVLGALIHTLITEKPWETDVDHGKPIMTEI